MRVLTYSIKLLQGADTLFIFINSFVIKVQEASQCNTRTGSTRLIESLHSHFKPNSITLAGSELVRSWFEPDSIMEFGF